MAIQSAKMGQGDRSWKVKEEGEEVNEEQTTDEDHNDLAYSHAT